MKSIVSVSNFSLDKRKFSNPMELDASLSQLTNVLTLFHQDKVEYYAGNDILEHKGFGPSFIEQANNFSYAGDKGVQAFLYSKLYQSYLNGFNLSLSTDELMTKANTFALKNDKESYMLYAPCLDLYRGNVIKDLNDFALHYENLLSYYPIDEESYYNRAKSHFDNILFHHDTAYTLTRVEGDFKDFSISFTNCLSALNDFSPTDIAGAEERKRATNSITKYKCTGQGYPHKNFKFDFPHPSGDETQEFELTCQYHLKPSDNNTVGDDTFYQNRIYFGFYPVGEKLWKVAVAAIGPHINTDNEDDRYAKPKNFNN
ncbi:hypothetical protein KW508_18635 [Vibrio fluvialis]|nr:hypothetical protein [Vibrio fluvialis]